MPRPKFPKPYTVLTPEMIRRIREEQKYYDNDPEKAEREQAARQERKEEEKQRELEELINIRCKNV